MNWSKGLCHTQKLVLPQSDWELDYIDPQLKDYENAKKARWAAKRRWRGFIQVIGVMVDGTATVPCGTPESCESLNRETQEWTERCQSVIAIGEDALIALDEALERLREAANPTEIDAKDFHHTKNAAPV